MLAVAAVSFAFPENLAGGLSRSLIALAGRRSAASRSSREC